MNIKHCFTLLITFWLVGCDANANPLMDKSMEDLNNILGTAEARSCFFVVDNTKKAEEMGIEFKDEFKETMCEDYADKVGFSKEQIADPDLRKFWSASRKEAECKAKIAKVSPDKLERWSKGIGRNCAEFVSVENN